ncbi:unnamed protein product [Prunus brigantina]
MVSLLKDSHLVLGSDKVTPSPPVLCMEKLSHIINDHVSSRTWKSVKVARNGPAISHLFFADDLILFGEASINQAKLMKHCLDLFCGASGQQVNFDKSRICCSPNTDSGIASTIPNICGSPLIDCLGNYLGVPLIQSRITKDTYVGIVDKVQRRLASWKSHTLSMAGRLTYLHTHCMNQALLAKTSWKIVQKDQGLWSQVLNGCGPFENFAAISLSDDLLEWTMSDFLTEQVKMAYLSLFIEETNHTWNWDTIWKLHVPPKIKTFVWLLFQGKLVTNVQRVRRNLAYNSNCPCCNVSMESLDHLFRGCSHTARMWNSIGIPNQIDHSFSMDFKDWLFINIKASFICMQGIPWSSLFLASLWFCWKWRCKKVFDVNFTPPHWPHIPIIQFTREWLVANCSRNSQTPKQILKLHWSPPCAGCFKINVDDSCMGEMGSISAGGIIRDSTGGWIKGFVTNLGCGKILEAELWGVFRGLLLTWNEGI